MSDQPTLQNSIYPFTFLEIFDKDQSPGLEFRFEKWN